MGRRKLTKAGVTPGERFTTMQLRMMQTEAWRALSAYAQALYPWLRMEWKGANANNNGNLRLSTRQGAGCMGVDHKTVARAFAELQAKGFVFVTEAAHLGNSGNAKSPTFELTELPTAASGKNVGRKLYEQWAPGNDFPVVRTLVNNPTGRNGKTKPCPAERNDPVPSNGTERADPVPSNGTSCPARRNGMAAFEAEPVPPDGTSLSLPGQGAFPGRQEENWYEELSSDET